MSPYAEELAHARLGAIRQLVTAMEATDDPAETRRCALAIFSAPDPCDLDDEIELVDDEDESEDEDGDGDTDGDDDDREDTTPDTPSTPLPRAIAASRADRSTTAAASPASLAPNSASPQPVPLARVHIAPADVLIEQHRTAHASDLGPFVAPALGTPASKLIARAGLADTPPPDSHRPPNSDLIAVHINRGSDFTVYGTYSDTMMHVHPPVVRGVPCSAPAPMRK